MVPRHRTSLSEVPKRLIAWLCRGMIEQPEWTRALGFERLEDRHLLAVINPGEIFDSAAASAAGEVVARLLFYNQSKFDGLTAGVSPSDDAAIATDKSPLLIGGAATFANVSSYKRGINGLMIDLAGDGDHGAITAVDFTFRVGNNNSPDTWASAPAPTTVSVRAGAGTSGSDRIELIWANGDIANEWLEVIVAANVRTGLVTPDAFIYGSKIGDTGLSDTAEEAITDMADEVAARHNQGVGATVTNVFDFDRSGIVNATDQIIARTNAGSIALLNVVPLVPHESNVPDPPPTDFNPITTSRAIQPTPATPFLVFRQNADSPPTTPNNVPGFIPADKVVPLVANFVDGAGGAVERHNVLAGPEIKLPRRVGAVGEPDVALLTYLEDADGVYLFGVDPGDEVSTPAAPAAPARRIVRRATPPVERPAAEVDSGFDAWWLTTIAASLVGGTLTWTLLRKSRLSQRGTPDYVA